MSEVIGNWNPVATFFAVWGLAGLITAAVIIVVTSRIKGRAQAKEDEIVMLEALLHHSSGEDTRDA